MICVACRPRRRLAPAVCTNCAMGQTPLGQGGVVPGGAPGAFAPPVAVTGGVSNPKAVKDAAFDGIVNGAVQSAASAKAGVVAAVTGALQHVVQSKEARPCACALAAGSVSGAVGDEDLHYAVPGRAGCPHLMCALSLLRAAACSARSARVVSGV